MKTICDDCLQPEGIVGRYYQALYSGDLQGVKNFMTEKSYVMVLESFGFRLSLKDPSFKVRLEEIEESESSLQEVEKKLSAELLLRKRSPHINIQKVKANGAKRKTVSYEEDGKAKKLYFSKEDGHWLINYYAGCPTPQSHLSSIKEWITSILPSFK